MFITRIGDHRCCTCNHWQGVRVTENDGYIYSLKDVEGICHDLKPAREGQGACMSLTFPTSSCSNWHAWTGSTLPEAPVPAEMPLHGATAASMI